MTGPVDFPLGSTRSACLCLAQGAPLPQTLNDLDVAAGLTSLHGDLDALALIGTQLNSSVISTNNGVALLSQTGGYGPMTTTAMPHRLSRKRVNLRIEPYRSVHLALSGMGGNGRQTLVVADTAGVIFHRIEVADTFDQAVIRSLDVLGTDSGGPKDAEHKVAPDNIVSLTAVRCARIKWDDSDTGQHLNDILIDSGKTRLKTLPHIGRNKAWRILPDVLQYFISHLHKSSVDYALNVAGTGLIQSMIATGGTPHMLDDILMVQNEMNSFALDLAQVGSVWITFVAGSHQIEIYSRDGRAVAVLGADPAGDIRHWDTLLCSLPNVRV